MRALRIPSGGLSCIDMSIERGANLINHIGNLTNELSPFVKWAGGKRQLLPQIKNYLPQASKRYIEPFVGGGAVCFALQRPGSLINDINASLINTYKVIKQVPDALIDTIQQLDREVVQEGKAFYYAQRQRYNDKMHAQVYDVETAALLIFLNKHCFNGLYRVNSHGAFNVPYNNSIRPSVDVQNIYAIADFLQSIEITQGDFAQAAAQANAGDFVFFDSPYAPLNPTSFEAYTKEGFSLEDHQRLAAVFKALTAKGCYCMLTNHNTELIRELYAEYPHQVVQVRRAINSDASKRTGEEVIICNYAMDEAAKL